MIFDTLEDERGGPCPWPGKPEMRCRPGGPVVSSAEFASIVENSIGDPYSSESFDRRRSCHAERCEEVLPGLKVVHRHRTVLILLPVTLRGVAVDEHT